jgi:hypothetical protein
MTEKIRFKDLSAGCQVGVIGGWLYVLICAILVLGFVLGV